MQHAVSIAAATLIAALTACHAPSNAVATTHSRGSGSDNPPPAGVSAAASDSGASDPTRSSSLVSEIGADCEARNGTPRCTLGDIGTGDFYDVEVLDDCSSRGFFAGVIASKADLLSTLPVTGSEAGVNATVSSGQFLCVRATARAGQQPAYFYVSPMRPDEIDACRNQETCKRFASRPVIAGTMRVTGECTVDNAGRTSAQCFRGWIHADAVEPFSNGL